MEFVQAMEEDVIELNAEQAARFAEALANPPAPSAALREAAEKYHKAVDRGDLEFVQATKEDVLSIEPQPPQGDTLMLEFGREVFERDLVPLPDRAIAIRDCGRCIGAYGLLEMWPGSARVWALFSEALIAQHPVLLGLHVKRDLERTWQDGFHRIEATCDVDYEAGVRFLERLGFEREGLMRRYSPGGQDNYLYARVRDEL